MTDFTSLLSSLVRSDGGFTVTTTDDWLQGRTIYGGLSAALCIEGAKQSVKDLPPLRSAQFTFAGPAVGELTIRPSVLRKGKTTTFVGVDLSSSDGLATHGTLCFSGARSSSLSYQSITLPDVAEPGSGPDFFRDAPGIKFVQHFEGRLAAGNIPFSRAVPPAFSLWIRHRDKGAWASLPALIALADALPPAAIVLFDKPAPLSTMTWSIDLLTTEPQTRDGWWLVRTVADSISDGYCSQTMTIWNADRVPVISARQNVAVFI